MNPNHLAIVEGALRRALSLADKLDLVVTVEQIPLKPFAMGHYETMYTLRPARHPKETK